METSKTNIWVRIGLIGAAVFIVALFVFNLAHREPNQHTADEPWSMAMVEGRADAPNRMVEYTDYFCVYCSDFAEQAESEKFQTEYIDSGKLRLESRIVTVLDGPMSPNSGQGAEAAFCAADQNKFWPYSRHIVPRIKQDFFDKGIGVKTVAVPKPIEKLPLSYFEESARAVGLDEEAFTSCMNSQKHRDEIATNTNKAIQLGVTGLPYIAVNDYTASGFQAGWVGMEYILKAGQVE